MSEPTTPLIVSPPYAKITHPEAWTSVRVSAGEHLPDAVLADAEAGKVLVFSANGYTSAWPYLVENGEPVPRFDMLIEEFPRWQPEELTELVLLDDRRLDDVYLDPTRACDLGLITVDERDALIEDAVKMTAARIEATLMRTKHWTPDRHAKLVALRDDPDRFFELATKHHPVRQGVVRRWWVWEAGPTVTELENLAGAPDRLRQLVRSRGLARRRQLEATMESAGRAAIARGYAGPEELAYYDAEWCELDEDEIKFDLGHLFD